MIAENAEIEASTTWRDKETVQSRINPNGSGGAGQAGSKVGSKPLSVHRDDREGRNFVNECGQAVFGGILDRLISNTSYQIKESEDRTAELKRYLQDLQELSKQFQEPEKPE